MILFSETVKNFVYETPPSKGKINLRRRGFKMPRKRQETNI